MIDWSQVKTAEQQAQGRWQAEYDAAAMARANAYRLESDPLKTEAEFDAIKAGTEPNYSAWIAKVEEIKARYPLPDQPTSNRPGWDGKRTERRRISSAQMG